MDNKALTALMEELYRYAQHHHEYWADGQSSSVEELAERLCHKIKSDIYRDVADAISNAISPLAARAGERSE